MKQWYFLFDPNACFGCGGCIAACINENQLPGSYHLRKVLKLPPKSGKSNTRYISLACNHCENPPCVNVCPTEAMVKRKQDGVVVHHPNLCMGCRYCQMACPYGAITWVEEKKIVGKCILCVNRLERKEKPACVETCFGNALKVLTKEELQENKNLSNEILGFTHHKDVGPNIRFRSFKKDDPEKEG